MSVKRGISRKGQIWVETVVYTLIALVMIGIVLSVVKPKIEDSQDRAIIDQSIELMKSIDSVILDIKRAPGNQRIIEIGIKKGSLIIDGLNDRIIFEMVGRHEYSEPGGTIVDSNTGIIFQTSKTGKFNNVTLMKDYSSDYNITYKGDDKSRSISKSSTPYRVFISNKGEVNSKIIIDTEVI